MSPFVIDGNTHAPPIIMFLLFISPFDINKKGNYPQQYLSPYALDVQLTTAFLLSIMLINLEQKLFLVSVRDTQKYPLGEA